MNTTDGVRTASADHPVRQVSFQQRLSPYFGESGGNELFYPNKADRPWKYVVLHHSANPTGNYDQIDHEHRKLLGYDGCGYHFVIGNGTGSEDGQIEVAQRGSIRSMECTAAMPRTPRLTSTALESASSATWTRKLPRPGKLPRPRL